MRFFATDPDASIRVPPSTAPGAKLPSRAVLNDKTLGDVLWPLLGAFVSGPWTEARLKFGMVLLVRAFSGKSAPLCDFLWASFTAGHARSDEEVRELLECALTAPMTGRRTPLGFSDVVFLSCECRLYQLARIALKITTHAAEASPSLLAERRDKRDALAPAVFALLQTVLRDEPRALARRERLQGSPAITTELEGCQQLVTSLLGALRVDFDELPKPKYVERGTQARENAPLRAPPRDPEVPQSCR